MRRRATLTEVYAREIRWGVAGLGVLALLTVLFFLLRTDPLQKELTGLADRQRQLDDRLVQLRAQPTNPDAGVNPLAGLTGLAARARELETRTRQAVNAGDADAARNGTQQLDALARQGEEMRQAARRPSGNAGALAVNARQEITNVEALQGQLDNLRQRVASHGDQRLGTRCESLDGAVQETMAGFRKLLKDGGGHPVDPAAADRLLAAIQASGAEAKEAFSGMVAPTKVTAPFDDKEATLVVGCTSDLAATLLVPLLRARTNGKAIPVSADKCYYLAGAGGPAQERVILNRVDRSSLTELFRRGIDLVVTEREPDAAEAAAFTQVFPGNDLGSRAVAEVIALDALTFLVSPSNGVQNVDANGPQAARNWVGGAPGSAEGAAAERFGLSVGQRVTGPVADEILTRAGDIGLGVYHLEGSTSKARQLPCRSGAQVLLPSPFTIATEDYKFSYRIVAYQNPQSVRTRADILNLVRFITSDKGQETVAAQGYVDLRLRPAGGGQIDPTVLASIAHALGLKSIRTATRLSTNFRYATGADRLDLKAQADAVRLPIAMARDFPRARVAILGFTDNVGGSGYNQPLSVRRADGVAALLKQAGVDTGSAGLSDQLPVDTNDTEEGRARNRRCEVWVVPP